MLHNFFNIATQEGQSQDPPARRQRSAICARLNLLTERVHRALENPKPGRQLFKKNLTWVPKMKINKTYYFILWALKTSKAKGLEIPPALKGISWTQCAPKKPAHIEAAPFPKKSTKQTKETCNMKSQHQIHSWNLSLMVEKCLSGGCCPTIANN